MHDVTEGGVANALWEIAEASKVGLVVSESEIPRFWESTKLAQWLSLDLLGSIGSGALILTVAESEAEKVIKSLADKGVPAYLIGRVVKKQQGVKMLRGQDYLALPKFTTDEISRALSTSETNDT